MNLEMFENRILKDLYLFGDESTGNGANKTEKKEIILPCTCLCSMLSITKYSDENEYYFQFYNSYNSSKSFIGRIKEAWRVLRGYYNSSFGLVVSEEDFKKLINNEN